MKHQNYVILRVSMGNFSGIFPKSISDAWVLVWFTLPRGERDGSVDIMDGKETVGNSSWGELLGGRYRKPRWKCEHRGRAGNRREQDGSGKRGHRGRMGNCWKSLGESLVGRERDIVDGQETVGNGLGRAPLEWSETEAWTSWTDRKPWEIACGELRGARRKRGHRGRETVGNSLGRSL